MQTIISSGNDPIETTDDEWTDILEIPGTTIVNNVIILNEGDAAGFFRIVDNDGETAPARLPAGPGEKGSRRAGINLPTPKLSGAKIQVKRGVMGDHLSGLWAFATKLLLLAIILTGGCAGPRAPMSEIKDLGAFSNLDKFGVAELKHDNVMNGNAWAVDANHIMTCYHVIGSMSQPWTINGHVATLLYFDVDLDIAVLDCPSHGLPAYRIRESHIGESANLIGFLPDWGNTRAVYIGAGKINSLHYHTGYLYNGGCQPGISGSPTFGEDGCIIGMVKGYVDCRGSANTTHTCLVAGPDLAVAYERAMKGMVLPPPKASSGFGWSFLLPPATRPATRPSK